MFDEAKSGEDIQRLSMSGNGSSSVHVVAYRPHGDADLGFLYIPGYDAPYQTDPKTGAIHRAAQQVGADAFFFNYRGQNPDEPWAHLCLETYMDDAATALEQVLDRFKQRYVVLCSQSMGAVFALNLAARYRRNVVGGVLIAPVIGLMDPPVTDEEGKVVIEGGLGYKRILQVPSIAARLEAGEPVSPKGISVLEYVPKFLRDYGDWGAMNKIPQGIDQPIAIITAGRDAFVDATHVEAIQKRVPGCETILVVPGATHAMKEDPAIDALEETLVAHMPKARARLLHLGIE